MSKFAFDRPGWHMWYSFCGTPHFPSTSQPILPRPSDKNTHQVIHPPLQKKTLSPFKKTLAAGAKVPLRTALPFPRPLLSLLDSIQILLNNFGDVSVVLRQAFDLLLQILGQRFGFMAWLMALCSGKRWMASPTKHIDSLVY